MKLSRSGIHRCACTGVPAPSHSDRALRVDKICPDSGPRPLADHPMSACGMGQGRTVLFSTAPDHLEVVSTLQATLADCCHRSRAAAATAGHPLASNYTMADSNHCTVSAILAAGTARSMANWVEKQARRLTPAACTRSDMTDISELPAQAACTMVLPDLARPQLAAILH